jgi:hypothetical protein
MHDPVFVDVPVDVGRCRRRAHRQYQQREKDCSAGGLILSAVHVINAMLAGILGLQTKLFYTTNGV